MNKKNVITSVVDLESVFPDGRIVGGEEVDIDAMRRDMANVIAANKESK